MAPMPPLPDALWRTASPELQAAILLLVQQYEQRIAGLEQQVGESQRQIQELRARLDQNSTNSSKPPSTDPIGVKRKPPAPPSRKRRGGQKGHPRRMRALVPPELVTSVMDCKPVECRRCGHPLSG